MDEKISKFFLSEAYGVIGASNNREKYGNKVLRCYKQHHLQAYPVNPTEKEVEGLAALPNIDSLPSNVKSLSVITPPPVTEKIVEQAIAKKIENIWMQPGAESVAAIQACEKHRINVIAGGPCILVHLGFKDI